MICCGRLGLRTMEDRVLYDANYTTVTRTVVRFLNRTYHLRNIDSVTVHDTRRVGPVTVFLLLVSLAAYGAAYVYFNLVVFLVGSALLWPPSFVRANGPGGNIGWC